MFHDKDTEYYKHENRTIYRYFGGVLHCEDGPAIIRQSGVEEWFYEGKRHRVTGPAIISKDRCEWYYQNKLHREDGPAIELANGDRFWYYQNNLHREDGPAIELANGDRYWYIDDELHRADGPAYEKHSIGILEWYIRGKRLTDDEANFLRFCSNK